MATGKKAAAAKVVKVANSPAGALSGIAELKAFHYGGGKIENFGFVRYWWEGGEPRPGISSKVLQKFRPATGPEDDPDAVTAARTDVLIPLDAQADYMEAKHLLQMYDARLPMREKHAFVQVTLRFPEARNLHAPFEEARSFAMRHMVMERSLAVILVLHAPNLAGSANSIHAHLLVPLRRLGPLGWGEVDRKLASDRGMSDCFDAWTAFRREWSELLREALPV